MIFKPYNPTLLEAWKPGTEPLWLLDMLYTVKNTVSKFTESFTTQVVENEIYVFLPSSCLYRRIVYLKNEVVKIRYSSKVCYALPITLLVRGKDGKASQISSYVKIPNYIPELLEVPENQLELLEVPENQLELFD